MNTYIVLTGLFLLMIWIYHLRNKRAKNKVICVINDHCTGCRRCVKTCRRKVLGMVQDKTGTSVTIKYPEKCTACRDCILICKWKVLKLTDRRQQNKQVSPAGIHQ